MYYTPANQGKSKVVAEIEFLQKDEIKTELKFMANLVSDAEARKKKENYLTRQYKSLSAEERKSLIE